MKMIAWWGALLALGCSCAASKKNTTVPVPVTHPITDSVPMCIRSMIEKYKAEDRQNPPRQVFSYQYKGQTVYYVTPPCCDFFSELYDSACTLIAQPDGGFTGRGDGRAPDFDAQRSNEKLIWKDERKP